MQTFEEILQKYRDISFSERDKGYRFERLMQSFLKTYPKYINLFTSIWLWNEFGFVVFTEAKEGERRF
jgi:predicted helicase